MPCCAVACRAVPCHDLSQLANLDQRLSLLQSENDVLASDLAAARSDLARAQGAAANAAALDGLSRQERQQWPASVLRLVTEAERAAVVDLEEKHVSARRGCQLSR